MLEKLRGYIPVNTELAGNPINWVIVLIIVFIAGLSLSLFFQPNETGD